MTKLCIQKELAHDYCCRGLWVGQLCSISALALNKDHCRFTIMGILLESIFIEMLIFFVSICWLCYWYLTKNYDYWKKRGVPYKKPEFPFGSLKDIILTRTYSGKGHDQIYKEFPSERFYGIIEFRNPVLVLKDPELVKKVMVKDFQYFVDRPVFMGNPKEYMLLHLLNLTGQQWKDMRAKLTPTFSSGKMKMMFELMERSSEKLKEKLENDSIDGKTIDAKNILSRFTMEIIASCAFGLDTNTINDKNTEFFRMFGGIVKTSKLRYIRRTIFLVFPSLVKIFKLNLLREELRSFVTNIVRDTIEYRQKNNVKRNDFLDLLINIRQNNPDTHEENEHTVLDPKSNSVGLTVEQMAAQTFVFFIAGFETASSLMSFCLYELAHHQDIQEKLYLDIREVTEKYDGKITYQSLMEIPFLDQVINETMRLYGTAHVLSRVCTQPYKIPDSDLVLEKGSKVIIPLYSLHHDPQYYLEPYEFKPERFTPEESKERHPFVFLPFGEGPRNCIGMRFGLMQAKVGLATVIQNFQVELAPEQEVPIEIHKRTIVMLPANPVRLKFNKRTNS